MKWILIIIMMMGMISAAGNCRPSEVLYKEHVIYNFTSEGFLMPDVLQTIGKADVTRLDAGLDAGRSRCLDEALYKAKNRAVRIMFHTNLDIPGGGSTFDSDYPVQFSESEYIRGIVDFSPVISKGYIALQDSRSSSSCYVVFRIMEKNLIRKIREVDLTFCVNYMNYKVMESFSRAKNYCGEYGKSLKKIRGGLKPHL